ncbi:TBC1 domain family member 12-like isoform X1 [Amphibalanus amphitrite]|uniref:TBC1 domain family member 12-like isoform X1 n=1 Tax=Amphibalanus amphitrite TaxID=1232801 RepID=UPI001C915602|nr:TBC1 domain family member 12-like isoform X1 [Amphibalanus amphitrite]
MVGSDAVTVEAEPSSRTYYNTWPDGRAGTECRCQLQASTDESAAGDPGSVYQHRCQTCAGADCMHPCRDPGRHYAKLGLSAPPASPQGGGRPSCCCHKSRSAPSASGLCVDSLPLVYDRRTRQLRLQPAVPPPPAAPPPPAPGKPGLEEERDSGVGESPSSTLQQGAAAPRPLRRADGSLSSTSSLSTDYSLYSERPAASDGGSSRDLSAQGAAAAAADKAAKKRGISGLFSRGLFSWRSKESQSPGSLSTNVPGWRLFNKSQADDGDASHTLLPTPSCTSLTSLTSLASLTSSTGDSPCRAARRNSGLQAGSMGLILEPRPHHLPAKSRAEESRHRLEHQRMLEEARRRDQKDSKSRKKAIQAQLKTEHSLAQSTKIWNQDILPNWEKVRHTRKVSDLWWNGLPPSVRGRVWMLALGNDLHVTPQLYKVYHQEALSILRAAAQGNAPRSPCEVREAKTSSVDLIRLDVARTFPQLGLFQKGGPYHDLLHELLGTYACYRPDVGYIQGMSFIAAVLLLNTDPEDAFVCFANLLNRPFLFSFFQLDQSMMSAYYATYTALLRENLPALWQHMEAEGVTPDLYLVDWLYTLFSKSLPLDVACRIWDVFLRDGEAFLARAALGILHLYDEQLRSMEFINLAQFLTGLPDDLDSEALFKSITKVHTSIGRQTFHDLVERSRRPSPLGSPR